MGSARNQFDLLINAITTVLMLALAQYTAMPNELAVAIVGLVACLLVFGGALWDDRQAAATAAAAVAAPATTSEPPSASPAPPVPPTQPARRTPKPPKDTGTTKEA